MKFCLNQPKTCKEDVQSKMCEQPNADMHQSVEEKNENTDENSKNGSEKRRKTRAKYSPIVAFFVLLFLANSAMEYDIQQLSIPPEELIRFHIIAQDDSAEKQREKLLLRDEILKQMAPMLQMCTSKEEMRQCLQKNLPQLQEQCKAILQENYINDDVQVVYQKEDFPLKYYGMVSLPGGEYEALKIIIGEGKGQNWWCVLYPQICIDAAGEPTEINQSGVQEVVLKWRIVQWWEKLFSPKK